MAQPSSLNQTFDTSLIDVKKSFSSTETDTSGSSAKENQAPTQQIMQRDPSPYQTVPTDVLYAQWASTYDTDGNVLQAVDDIQMQDLLPQFVRFTTGNERLLAGAETSLQVLDLGCGTGRNTVKLLQSNWPAQIDIVGWDSSEDMLDLARKKCEIVLNQQPRNLGIELEQIDISRIENVPDRFSGFFDGLISSLVLEHIPIQAYFAVLARVLKAGSYALITNMHADMGALSRAGYKTSSGERFKATSYIYTVDETVQAAQQAGFELVQPPREVAVDESMFGGETSGGAGKVAERAKKWIGTTIWFGVMFRKL